MIAQRAPKGADLAPPHTNGTTRPLGFPSMLGALALAGLLGAACGGTEGPKLFLGDSCAAFDDTACRTGVCLRLDDETAYCTEACDAEAQDCPEGFLCQPTANPSGDHCVMRSAGGACADDADCPSGHLCDTSPGPGQGVCYIPVTRGLCAPCNSDLQCPSGGGCFETATGEHLCTAPCDGGCPTGYACQDLPRLGQQCVPERQTCSAGRPLCASCRGDAECGGYLDLCVKNLVTGEQFCAQDCAGDPAACPQGFGCTDLSGAGDGPFQCVPNASTCEGYCDAPAGDVARAEAQCGFGFMCDAESGTCFAADDGRLCAPCADDDDCRKTAGSAGNLCMMNRDTGETFCGRDCATDPCPLGFSCIDTQAAGTTHRQCVPTRGSCRTGTGRLDDDCSVHGADDCLTGICLDFGRMQHCSARCTEDADCAEGGLGYTCCGLTDGGAHFDCAQGPATGEEGVCAPRGGDFGDDCTPGQPPCRSGLCLDIGTARLCSESCATDADCEAGFRCADGQDAESGEAIRICFPSGGGTLGADCTFGPAACESRLCIKTSGQNLCAEACGSDGSCPEDWVCDPEAQTVDGKDIEVCVPPQLAP